MLKHWEQLPESMKTEASPDRIMKDCASEKVH